MKLQTLSPCGDTPALCGGLLVVLLLLLVAGCKSTQAPAPEPVAEPDSAGREPDSAGREPDSAGREPGDSQPSGDAQPVVAGAQEELPYSRSSHSSSSEGVAGATSGQGGLPAPSGTAQPSSADYEPPVRAAQAPANPPSRPAAAAPPQPAETTDAGGSDAATADSARENPEAPAASGDTAAAPAPASAEEGADPAGHGERVEKPAPSSSSAPAPVEPAPTALPATEQAAPPTKPAPPAKPAPTPAKPAPTPAKPEPARPAATEAQPQAKPSAPPENIILDRNLQPGGRDPYRLPLAQTHVVGVSPAGRGVTIRLESGRSVQVGSDGTPVLDPLRDSSKPVGSATYLDAYAAYFIVAGLDDPTVLNGVIKDVGAYPSYIDNVYHYSFYRSAAVLPVGNQQGALDRNKADVTTKLAPYGLTVEPADSRFTLAITIGNKNWVEKTNVTLEMMSTSYVLKDAAGKVVKIVNENTLVKCTEGGTKEQNVVWVMEPIAGVGTLVRYYQASVSDYDGKFKEKRQELYEKNVIDYLRAIHDRTRTQMK